ERVPDFASSFGATPAQRAGNTMMPARRAVDERRASETSTCEQTALRLYRMERWEAAADALQRLLKLDPNRDGAGIALGDCFLRLNRPEEALESFDQCRAEMERPHALFGKAIALQRLRRFDEAEAAYESLLAIDPESEEALSNLVALAMEVFDRTR